MKPTLHVTEKNNRRDSLATRRNKSWPMTDYQFQDGSLGRGYGGGDAQPLPSFRGISAEYFRTEARSHFAMEAAFFALIVLIVAVPVFEGVSGLFQFVYSGL